MEHTKLFNLMLMLIQKEINLLLNAYISTDIYIFTFSLKLLYLCILC